MTIGQQAEGSFLRSGIWMNKSIRALNCRPEGIIHDKGRLHKPHEI